MKKLIIAIAAVAAFTSCTKNQRVKQWGGTADLEIPSNQKFVNVTWKETELWVVTRDRTTADTTYETYRFQEESNWGVMEGTYVITELKKK